MQNINTVKQQAASTIRFNTFDYIKRSRILAWRCCIVVKTVIVPSIIVGMSSAPNRAIQKSTLRLFIWCGSPLTSQECAAWFCGTQGKLSRHCTQLQQCIRSYINKRAHKHSRQLFCRPQQFSFCRPTLVDNTCVQLLHALHFLLQRPQA